MYSFCAEVLDIMLIIQRGGREKWMRKIIVGIVFAYLVTKKRAKRFMFSPS
jgi:hypothetical protein